jgi:hypothetical protein
MMIKLFWKLETQNGMVTLFENREDAIKSIENDYRLFEIREKVPFHNYLEVVAADNKEVIMKFRLDLVSEYTISQYQH